ncbi:non-heme iron oxygenase ferredoxin subunit [Deinococcus metallilatus]|uniref:3-phenylpropionate/trans-cinnamate dioxygenase ferredoxin subunit n=1 Tax=Deinococcus metallilatus TaxID=1211322 RepID=A0AAJ5JY55_9DEIO|nr:non-heme iron oxygenase ferredoxin subunit [Deinococcus metallilatus]MBB5295406.1 3-phenylpropionate/trans-cinnamate dioxygenase ferredoxin subunit [Deinococcus metallilatus]QBY08066.1 non-heme iron oxygenase ferredoxin subunit [Deinococcus metallilatus]RXJ12959.1 non-heme iron oxygenase ferredoxin subunit [Deinococcus metallilatus]TLK27119.1 non-heme iron oxygenase ferredoxin subunit [Deinococcus metallilatus]GMA16083.1 ferredoxin [Deinococcus metallilatus]
MSEQVGVAWVRVGAEAELPEGSQTEVTVDGVSVVVVRYEGQFYALRNNCTHKDYPLLGGEVSMGRITCQKHGAKFELSTGKAKTLPAVKPVRIYRTLVEDGEVYVAPL